MNDMAVFKKKKRLLNNFKGRRKVMDMRLIYFSIHTGQRKSMLK